MVTTPTTAASQSGPVQIHPLRIVLLLGGGVVVAIAAAVAGIVCTGGADTQTFPVSTLIAWGRPIANVMLNLSLTLTIGFLLLGAWALPGRLRQNTLSRTQTSAMRAACWSAAVWVLSASVLLYTTTADIVGPGGDAASMTHVALGTEAGLNLVAVTALSLTTTLLCLLARTPSLVGWATASAFLALVPLALSGHASGSDDHSNAVNALGVHLLSVTIWVGGLAAVLVLYRALGDTRSVAVRRYSTLAGWCFAGVAISGIINSVIRVGSVSNLTTTYGLLIIVKAVALVLLGIAGWFQRRRLLRSAAEALRGRTFLTLAVSEILVMSLAMGVSVALSSSAPPAPPLTPGPDAAVRGLLGFPMPAPPTAEAWFTTWQIDVLWLTGAAIASIWYLRAAHRLRRRGDQWPVLRDVLFVAGCALLVWVTCGAPAVYGKTSFSGHMIQHMALMMYIPPLIVAAAPVLLMLRTTPARTDGSRGIREWVLAVLNSRYGHFLTRPAVAGFLFAGSMVAFYYSPAFEFALRSHLGHMAMCVHFLLTGYLFVWVIIGIDPGAGRASYPMRLIMMLVTLAFHAFFGLALMSDVNILAPTWWADLGLTNQDSLLADQHIGGGIAWGAGEMPTVIIAIVLGYLWQKDDRKESIRADRQADRDGDAELAAYNARLQALAGHRPTPTRNESEHS